MSKATLKAEFILFEYSICCDGCGMIRKNYGWHFQFQDKNIVLCEECGEEFLSKLR